MDQSPNLETAEGLISKAKDKAGQLGVSVSIAVVDGGGYLIALERMDGAGILTPEIARSKAYTAVAFRRSTLELTDLFKNNPQTFGGVVALSPYKLVAGGGGVAIKINGRLVGGLGVSGGTGDQDQTIAEAAIA